MAGIGERAGGILSLLGLNIGNDEDENIQAGQAQMPTQVASNTPQSGGGFLSNVSNSLFKGMSQEEVYNMGMAFNTLRLEPDDKLAANFQSKIDKISKNKLLTAKNNDTIAYLQTLKSPEYPNGRQDLIQLIQSGLMPSTDALTEARTVKPTSALQEKMNFLKNNENLSDDQRAILGIASSKSDWQQKLEYVRDNPELSDGELQVLGVSRPLEYKQKIEDLKDQLEAKSITQDEYDDFELQLITGQAPDDGKTPKYKMLEMVAEDRGLVKGTTEWNDFFDVNMAGSEVSVEIGDTVVEMDSKESASNLYLKEYMPQYIKDSTKIMQDVDTAKTQVEKLGNLLDILEADDGAEGISPYTGIFQPFLTQATRVVTSLGIDKKYASEIEAYKNSTGEEKATARDILYEKLVKTEITKVMTGSDVFPMISSLGIGARGLDTPAERDFLISVMTGLPNMTIDTLKYMTKFRLQMYIDGLEKYNAKVDSGYFNMHNENPNLPQRERIDIEPLRRYTTTGEKKAATNVKTYTDAERNLIFGNLN